MELSQAPETKDMLSDGWYGCGGWEDWRSATTWVAAREAKTWSDKVQAGNRLLLPGLMIN